MPTEATVRRARKVTNWLTGLGIPGITNRYSRVEGIPALDIRAGGPYDEVGVDGDHRMLSRFIVAESGAGKLVYFYMTSTGLVDDSIVMMRGRTFSDFITRYADHEAQRFTGREV